MWFRRRVRPVDLAENDVNDRVMEHPADDRFAKLTPRQRELLRLVHEHRKSAEIAHMLGLSARYVDNQLIDAKNILGATSRFDAARRFAAHESGVESIHPVSSPSSPPPLWPLPMPLPDSTGRRNMMSWQQVALWGAIIAIATPVGLTVAAMVIVALGLLFGQTAS